MTAEQVGLLVGILILAAAAFDGVRSTRMLRSIHVHEKPPRNRITFALYVVSVVITAAAAYFGVLTVRRLMGFEPFPGASIVSLGVSIAVLFIPRFLRMTVERIRRGPA